MHEKPGILASINSLLLGVLKRRVWPAIVLAVLTQISQFLKPYLPGPMQLAAIALVNEVAWAVAILAIILGAFFTYHEARSRLVPKLEIVFFPDKGQPYYERGQEFAYGDDPSQSRSPYRYGLYRVGIRATGVTVHGVTLRLIARTPGIGADYGRYLCPKDYQRAKPVTVNKGEPQAFDLLRYPSFIWPGNYEWRFDGGNRPTRAEPITFTLEAQGYDVPAVQASFTAMVGERDSLTLQRESVTS